MSDPTSGDVLKHRYEVEAVVGEGAMGVVYRVRDRYDGTVRALKTLDLGRLRPDEVDEARTLFEREARFLFGLGHPGFPHVTDYFVEDDLCCQVMDFIEGETLEARVERQGPYGEADVLPLALELASHLRFLHEHPAGPIVYRDLKPSNVIVAAEGSIHLVDFGIARVYKPGVKSDTQFLGTPGYAAPEQYGARQSSPASDVYALAATMRFAMSGEHPDPPGVPRKPLPVCSSGLAWMLERCLQDDPELRPRSAAWMTEMLEELIFPPPRGLDLAAFRQWLRHEMLHFPRSGILGFHPSWASGVGVILLGLVLLLVTSNVPRPHGGQATACKSNLKNIGTALEMYSVDSAGRFPPKLSLLTPNYLKRIPTCPVANADTYSTGFRSSSDPHAYTFVCSGHHHARVGYSPNYPQYNSWKGLIER